MWGRGYRGRFGGWGRRGGGYGGGWGGGWGRQYWGGPRLLFSPGFGWGGGCCCAFPLMVIIAVLAAGGLLMGKAFVSSTPKNQPDHTQDEN